jgi:hypothetical protein
MSSKPLKKFSAGESSKGRVTFSLLSSSGLAVPRSELLLSTLRLAMMLPVVSVASASVNVPPVSIKKLMFLSDWRWFMVVQAEKFCRNAESSKVNKN